MELKISFSKKYFNVNFMRKSIRASCLNKDLGFLRDL